MNPRLVDEICSVGKLESYRIVLEEILIRIHNNGCRVSTRYDVDFSNFWEDLEKGNRIQVSLRKVEKPLDIIWKLLHEFGHHLSGPQKSPILKLKERN